jgi:hypothetical protein
MTRVHSHVRPTFLLGGAQKAGTTALYNALKRHPDICMSRPKETEFFNWHYHRGWAWLAEHFAHYDGERVIGEASTRTLPTPEAPVRIASACPDIKLVFVLRDPIERAHSAFWYYLSQGILPAGTSFGAFIRNQGHPLRHEVVAYGRYDDHLRRFLDVFARDQMLVLDYRALRTHPMKVVQQVCSFVGVAREAASSVPERANVTRYPASKALYGWAKAAWQPVRTTLATVAPSLVGALSARGKRLLQRSKRSPLAESDRMYLRGLYVSSVRRTEDLTGLTLAHWPTLADVASTPAHHMP